MAERLAIDVGEVGRVTALPYLAGPGRRIGATLVLAHGAGAGQSSRFMVRFAQGLASKGLDVLTFNFPYIEQHRRVPDRAPKLEACFRAAIATARGHGPWSGHALFIGGKSMGGRIASHLAAGEAGAGELAGLVLLGYPLHPPGKPDQLRTAHLPDIRVPILCVQGARDPFGTEAEIRSVFERLAAPVTLHVVENGDHSLAPPKRNAAPIDEIHDQIQDAIVRWAERNID